MRAPTAGVILLATVAALASAALITLTAAAAAASASADDDDTTHLRRRLLTDDGQQCTSFCAGKASGLYANPCDTTCSTFFNCANGITYQQSCTSGLMFNPTLLVCDWPSNVVCGGNNNKQPPPKSSPPPPPAAAGKPRPPPPLKTLSPPPQKSKNPSPLPPRPSKPAPPKGPPTGVVFGPYKDVTINMNWNTNVMSTSITGVRLPVTQVMPPSLRSLTWGFATGECGAETWAGLTPASLVEANVQAFVNAGKQYIISTGGAAGAFRCGTDAGFTTFIKRYQSSAMIGIDFDIEGGQSQTDIDALVQRVRTARAGVYGNLRYSFTLATLGGASGNQLNTLGTWVMNSLKNAEVGWTNIFINLMVMDYGGACTVFRGGLCDMGQSAINAAKALNSHWGVPYSSIELTPMIGGNDSPGQTFTLADVRSVSTFVKQNGLGGLHFWSLDRDMDCPAGVASATCNSYGVAGTLGFTSAFLLELGSSPVDPAGPSSPPPPLKASSPSPPPTGGGGDCQYTIKSGDTLWALSQLYGITVANLQALNPGVVPTALQVGQVIHVPCGGSGDGNGGGGGSGGSQPPPPSAARNPSPVQRSSPPPPSTAGSGCPSGWSPAVGTIYDSWPKPGTTECVAYSGCTWAGMFNSIDGGSTRPCKNGAQWLNGGSGNYDCRFPEATVKRWSIAATYKLDAALLGQKLQVMVQGKPGVTVDVNVKDVCSDSDCSGCCKTNTGNKKWKLIDIEKWPASTLLGFDPTGANFDINNVNTPSAAGLRPGAPQSSVMPLCYKILGPADVLA